MESIYLVDFDLDIGELIIKNSNIINHIRALRLKQNEEVFVSNGKGIAAIGNFYSDKQTTMFKVHKYVEANKNENNYNLSILLASLDNKDRMEFAVEKAVELGVSNIYVAKSKYSGKKEYKRERLESKILAAFQQSMRSRLTNLFFLNNIFEIIEKKYYFSQIFVADISGNNLSGSEVERNSLIIIGPEGGLSEEELRVFSNNETTTIFKIGDSRLRAETAAISSISMFNSILSNKG